MQGERPQWNRRAVIGGLAGSFSLSLLGRAGAAPSGQPVRIGGTLALTGPLAQTALIHKIAAEIFIEQANKKDGLLGRPIEWVLYDDQSKPEVTRSLYEKLITVDKVDLLMGPYATSGILASVGVAQRYNKLLLQSSMGMPHLVTYDMAFPATPFGPDPSKTFPNKVFDLLAASKTPPKSVAIVTSKFPSAQFMSTGARQVAEGRGLKVALYLEYEFGTRDFGAIAARVKDANADFLWVGALGLDANQMIEAMKKLDYLPPRHFYLYPANAPLAALPDAKHALSFGGVEDHPPFTSNPELVQFAALYQERATKAGLPYTRIDGQGLGMYSCWQILAAAVNATKSLDDKVLAQWLKANKVDTLNGLVRFNEKYNHGDDLTKVRQLIDGKWVIVWPAEFAPPDVKAALP